MKEFVKAIELVTALNRKYTEERLSLDNELNKNSDITIGEESIVKSKLDKCEGKLLALQDVIELIKIETTE